MNSHIKKNRPFWETVALPDMTPEQWESLCDGCALCCLQKLEDEVDGEIYYTNVACQLLDISTDNQPDSSCRCQHYRERSTRVEHCLVLTPGNLDAAIRWLPDTCSYKLLATHQPLPDWHPLISGDNNRVHTAGISARGRCVSELTVKEEDLEEHIVHWVSGFAT